MKKLFMLVAFVVTVTTFGQSVAISDDGSTADASAILDVKSTTKGFLPPRMTNAERDAMTAAVPGLQIWCTDCVPTAAMYFYNGSKWSTGGTGITTQQSDAITANTDKIGYTEAAVSANTDVAVNTLKEGYTEAAVSANTDVAANTAKKGITTAQADIIDNTSGANTGDNATNTQYSAQAALITSLQAQINAFVTEYGEPLPSVAIGTQKWMKKNLDVATYRDGTLIPEVTDEGAWGALKTGAWCYYIGTDGTTYGKLYNWYAVMGITVAEDATPTAAQIAARKQLAPTGWHVPADEEWSTLTTFLNQEAPTGNVGGKMKETGTAHWDNPNGGATNSSGFTGLPGGFRNYDGSFYYVGSSGYWWSSTEYNTSNAWYRYLYYNFGAVDRNYTNKTFGYSVRCLRD
jgi:uncharacterized protein (TIGR02145 family)